MADAYPSVSRLDDCFRRLSAHTDEREVGAIGSDDFARSTAVRVSEDRLLLHNEHGGGFLLICRFASLRFASLRFASLAQSSARRRREYHRPEIRGQFGPVRVLFAPVLVLARAARGARRGRQSFLLVRDPVRLV